MTEKFKPDNSLAKKGKAPMKMATAQNIRQSMASDGMQRQLAAMINDPKRRDSMVSSMVGMVQQTPDLQKCELSSVFNAAIAGEALRLPYGFGYWYAVPRANNKKGKELGFKHGEYKEATFQPGYKGFVQLAMRSGEYLDIDVYEIKEGELTVNKRRITVDDVLYLENHSELETVGYLAFFELHNGFKKSIYMRRSEIVAHATEYSYFNDVIYNKLKNPQKGDLVKDAWKYSSQWYTDFDMMASKTVLKRLLSRWGILSVEMQSAIKADQAVVNEKGQPIAYPDNPHSPENKGDIVDAEITDDPDPAAKPEPKAKPNVGDLFKKNK